MVVVIIIAVVHIIINDFSFDHLSLSSVTCMYVVYSYIWKNDRHMYLQIAKSFYFFFLYVFEAENEPRISCLDSKCVLQTQSSKFVM